MDLPGELSRQLDQSLQPTEVEIIRAKRAILESLYSGQADVNSLIFVLHDQDGLRRENEGQQHMDLTSAIEVDRNNDHVLRERYRLAATNALAELVDEGLVYAIGDSVVTVPVKRAGNSGRYKSRQPTPELFGRSFMLARRLADNPLFAVLDPDVFTQGVEGLNLDPRTMRCLKEALYAYRRGLYLSSVTLLGAVSEGAWYSAGERLRDRDDQLVKALDVDNTTKVQSRVVEILRGGLPRGMVDDLQATAARLRDLRNYGVHPRSEDSVSQERFFTEEGAGLLLLDTHRYLVQFADAVSKIVAIGV